MLPVWLEVHVDDLLLARDAARWDEAAALLDRIAAVAEAEGARLSFRLRERFAGLDRHGFARALAARGHEVGWHAHGERLRQARDAVVAAGGRADVAAPGLVQAGVRGRERLLREARDLGGRVLTDRVEARVFAWQGWLAWAPLPGVVAMDVSVSPFSWGVLARRGGRVVPGRPDFGRLGELLAVAERQAPPPGALAFFGATVHEHDLAEPSTLRPADLDGLRRLLGRLGPRVRPSAAIAEAGPSPDAAPPRPPLRVALPSKVAARVDRWRARLRPTPPPDRAVRIGSREVAVRRIGPERPAGALVVVHGGESGLRQGLRFLGLPDDAFPDLAVWTFARTEGTFRTPGNPVHVADTRAVLEAALAEGVPTALLSWSGGLVPAARVADARVAALVDAEGPVDRFSLVPPGRPDHELADVDPWDDAAWAGREALPMLAAFSGRYLRLQGTDDHVHGAALWHARRAVAAARHGELCLVPGRLADHGAALAAAIRATLPS